MVVVFWKMVCYTRIFYKVNTDGEGALNSDAICLALNHGQNVDMFCCLLR